MFHFQTHRFQTNGYNVAMHSNERTNARMHARAESAHHSAARYRYIHTRSSPRPASVSVGTGGSGHAGNVADLGRAARSEALFLFADQH